MLLGCGWSMAPGSGPFLFIDDAVGDDDSLGM